MDKWQKILKEYWGYDDFRGIQREIIESIGAGRDWKVFVLSSLLSSH